MSSKVHELAQCKEGNNRLQGCKAQRYLNVKVRGTPPLSRQAFATAGTPLHGSFRM